MCFCFGRVSLHCFNPYIPGIIYGPISSRCMGVASRWNYNGECMIKIFLRAVVVTPSKSPPPTNNFRLYPPPVLRCFWKDLLMTPNPPHHHHPTSRIFQNCPFFRSTTTPPHPPPPPPIKTLIIHCFYGVYNVSSICHVLVSIKK